MSWPVQLPAATTACPASMMPTQVVLAALVRAPFPVVPAVGCRTPDQVASSFAGLGLHLDSAEVDLLLAAASLETAEGS